jgi:hypothetical protein
MEARTLSTWDESVSGSTDAVFQFNLSWIESLLLAIVTRPEEGGSHTHISAAHRNLRSTHPSPRRCQCTAKPHTPVRSEVGPAMRTADSKSPDMPMLSSKLSTCMYCKRKRA